MTNDHNEQLGKLRLELRDSENKLRAEFLSEIKLIRENHLAHIQADMNAQTIQVTKVSTNVDWLMRNHWIVATASIGGLVTGVINLI